MVKHTETNRGICDFEEPRDEAPGDLRVKYVKT